MDLFEKIFQKLSQHEIFSEKNKPGFLYLKDIEKSLNIFANSVVQSSIPVQLVASREFVGLYENQLFLPEKIDFFNSTEYNKWLYQNLILQTLAAHHLKINATKEYDHPLQKRIHFLERVNEVNLHLDKLFLGYSQFQNSLIEKMYQQINTKSLQKNKVFDFWRKHVLTRQPAESCSKEFNGAVKRKELIPDFIFYTIPCFEHRSPIYTGSQLITENLRQHPRQVESEQEKTYSGLNQSVEIEKEQANPVMHSFEKLETADEYEGGRRIDSGDDELEDHAKALDELNLDKVTRGGEAARSVYNAEATLNFEMTSPEPHTSYLNNRFYYPEWSIKKNTYIRNYCQLTQSPLKLSAADSKFIETLSVRNRFQIKHWQSRIQNIFSEPLWQRKLCEGDEIEVDEVIRDFAEMRSQKQVDARWYSKRKKQFNDFEVAILFDQSHSSDSWISNRRVLDVTLESVGTAGLLFDTLLRSVSVAGTWSSTRLNCSYQIYKEANSPWANFFDVAENIQPQGYTRLGPAIRHTTEILKKSPHKKKLMLLLTDGKPTDLDGYEGIAGVSDVAQACREAEQNGIFHHAIVFDIKQRMHFSKMFRHYVLLHDPKKVSEELFKILLRLQVK